MTRRAFDEGVTLFEVLVVGFIVATFAFVGYSLAKDAPANADRATGLHQLAAIMDKTRAEAAAAGVLVALAPSATGSSVTVYAGWSTATVIDMYAVPIELGLEDTTTTTASDTVVFYVRRNGTWYPQATTLSGACGDGYLIGAYQNATTVGSDGYAISCATFAAAPASS